MLNDRDVPLIDEGDQAPFSKGLMAQTLMSTGLAPERAYNVAAAVERRLRRRGPAALTLADRRLLPAAVARAAAEADVFLTEIKAAAVDVVAEGAAAAGRRLVFCDNEPVALAGDLAATVDRLAALAAERFAARAGAVRGDAAGTHGV